MSKQYEQGVGTLMVAIVGVLLFFVAIQSGVVPWAILLGAITSGVWFAASREWKQALAAGGSIACVVMLFGILNVLLPGWHGEVLEALTLS